jgi:PAS domain S-box-containing protein
MRRIVTVVAVYALIAASVTLLGWQAHILGLADWIGSGITQKPNNAIAVILCALALLLLGHDSGASSLPRILAAMAALIGGLTLLEHIVGINLGIDTLLFDELPGERATTSPGRMGPIPALSFLAIGAGIFLSTLDTRYGKLAYRLALVVLILNSIPLLGYIYGSDFLYALPHSTGTAFPTATQLIALSIGVMALIRVHGIVEILMRNDAGGMLLRRLLLPVILLPLLLGWLRLRGEELGYYDGEFGTATLTLLLVVLLCYVAGKSAKVISNTSAIISEQGERLRTTLASIGDGVIATDHNGRVTMINPVAESLTGWTSSEAIGQSLSAIFRIINEESRREVENPALRAMRDGIVQGLGNHTILCEKDGTERPIDDSAAPIQLKDGEIIGSVLTFRDVTEKRLAEQALGNAERRKDEFLATLAHELRNPLAPIRTSLHILKKPEADLALKERMLQIMERQILHMVRLIDDLLEVSRITRGMIELRRETVALASVVGNAVETTMPIFNSAGVELTIDLRDETVLLDADPVRITQVLVNLLNNAAKYTPHGGQVRLNARRDGPFAEISVRDTGVGIPPGMLNRVFDLFTRMDSARSHTQGLGIGLALVKNLVQMHGGSVEARSEGPGRGSEFLVRVPLSDSEVKQQDMGHDVHLNPPHRRILVVDDNRDAADSLAVFLRMEGAEVVVVYDGTSALKAMHTFKPEIVLLDIGMPVMDGYAVAEEVRRDPHFESMVLIAMTGWGQQEDRYRSKAAGFDAHLVKPPDPPTLLRLLNSFGVTRPTTASGGHDRKKP